MLTPSRVAVGHGGRAMCALCARATDAVYDPMPIVAGRIDEAVHALTGPAGILLGGADAFGHPQLPQLIAHAVERGVTRIGVETDGDPLTAGDNAAGIIHAGVRRFEVRILTVDATLGERLYARRDQGMLALRGITECVAAARYAGAAIAVSAVVPVCAHNLDDLAPTVAALAAAGVAGVRLDAAGSPTTAHTQACLCAACDTGMVDGIWVDVVGDVALPASHLLHAAESWSA